MLVDHQTNRLGGVARAGPDLQPYVTQVEPLAVGDWVSGEAEPSRLPERDDRAGGGGELQVPRKEVGVDMSFEDPLDVEAFCFCLLEVHPDIASRVDDDRPPSLLVADQIRRVRETSEIVLSEDQLASPFLRSTGRPLR